MFQFVNNERGLENLKAFFNKYCCQRKANQYKDKFCRILCFLALLNIISIKGCSYYYQNQLKEIFSLQTVSADNRCTETRRSSPVDRRPSTAEAPPIGQTHPFSKIAVTFEPVVQFRCPLRFRISFNLV